MSFLKRYKKLAHKYFTLKTCQALLQDGHKILHAAVKDNDSKLGNFRNKLILITQFRSRSHSLIIELGRLSNSPCS